MLDTPSSPRPWRIVAEEVSREFDPEKLNALIQELDDALKTQMFCPSPDKGDEKV
jgi:hypothetical protein